MKRRIFTLVLALVMLLGMLPMAAFADDHDLKLPGSDVGPVTNGKYTEGTWAPGGTGTSTYDVDGTQVEVSKTAAPVAGEDNTYDITLQVKTSTSVSTQTSSGAVVLVIDVSGSMDQCAECGNEYLHKSDCDHFFDVWDNSVTPEQNRLTAAKKAAKEFLRTYAGNDDTANRQLAIVTFSTGYQTLPWSNVAGGTGKNSYDSAVATIDGLEAGGGTNLEGGLYTALQNLNDSAVSSISSKNVILLTDGAPTYYMDGGNGRYGSQECNSNAAKQATKIKAAGATLYTVCFGAAKDKTYQGGPTVGNFLRDSIATSGKASNANNTTELLNAFKAITEEITSGLDGDGWTVTDPMANMIKVTSEPLEGFTTEDGKTYTWALSEPETKTEGNVTTYVYTCTYRVTLDVQAEGFEEGKYYPTNKETFLHIGDATYAFPVPGVKGVLPRTSVTVTKEWNDENNRDGIRPEFVTVQLKKDGIPEGNAVRLDASNGWSYTWEGLIEKSGGQVHQYTVEETNVAPGYEPAYSGENNNLVVTNTHEAAKYDNGIAVKKVWEDKDDQDGKRPDSVTVKLMNGEEEVATLTLTEAVGWKGAFTGDNLYVNENGKKIEYTVVEDEVEAYTTEVTGSAAEGFTVTNTHTPAKVDVTVTKQWVDDDNRDNLRPNSIEVELYANGNATGKTVEIVSNGTNTWTGKFEGLDQYAGGEEIKYTVKEVAVDGYTPTYAGTVITNTHEAAKYENGIAVEKVWEDGENQDGIRPEEVVVTLFANNRFVAEVTLSAENDWTFTVKGTDNLPLYQYENGVPITYEVVEEPVEGYESEVTGDVTEGFVVTNTHEPETVEKTVTKVWDDDNNKDGVRPESIEAIVYDADGKEVAKLTLTADNEWKASVELPKYKDGKEIVYTVKEATTLKDYKATYNQDTLTITNTIVRQMGTGDNFQLGLFIGLAAVSLCGIVTLVFLKKKKAKE